jgi:hypothetical protein
MVDKDCTGAVLRAGALAVILAKWRVANPTTAG